MTFPVEMRTSACTDDSEEEDASTLKKMHASVVMRVDDAMEMNERASCARQSPYICI